MPIIQPNSAVIPAPRNTIQNIKSPKKGKLATGVFRTSALDTKNQDKLYSTYPR